MAVTIKTTNYAFLTTLGIPAENIAKLKQHNIKLALGFFDLKLISAEGVELVNYKLPKNTNELMKGQVSGTVLEGIKGGINHAINTAVDKVASGDVAASVVVVAPPTGTLTVEEIAKQSEANSPFKHLAVAAEDDPKLKKAISDAIAGNEFQVSANVGMPIASILAMPPVKLKAAKMMYQPVTATTKGTRYFVVAMNTHARVAAKVHGQSVSMRVEGTMPATMKQAFMKVGIDDHGDYMSGHFECNDKVTPERLIGAILMGTGLEFQTPMPNLSAIKNVK